MRTGGVLALDLATDTGWCYGHPGQNEPPEFGTWHLNRLEGEGAKYASLRNELKRFLFERQPAHVIMEATLRLAAMNNEYAASQQYTLRGIVVEETWRKSIPRSAIDCRTVRREVMGIAHLSSKDKPRVVVAFCRKILGYRVLDHNAADACLTWRWHCDRALQIPPVSGPLFTWRTAA